jgi:hypothetical protein
MSETNKIIRSDDLRYLAQLNIAGKPVVSFTFEGLPSMNTYYNLNRWARSSRTAEWRYEAREKVYDHTDALWLPDNEYVINRALVVVNIYPPYEEMMDIHNIVIKPILDGFTDGGLWRDDEWTVVPLVLYAWAGIGEQKPRQHKIRRTRLDVYELNRYTVGGQQQILPKGRTWK